MLAKGIFKKKPTAPDLPDKKLLQTVFDYIDKSSISLNVRAISALAAIDDAETERCLQALADQKKVEIAYDKLGLDGIKRSYYRTSEAYKLRDTESKIGEFIADVVKKAKPVVPNSRSYFVKVKNHKEYDANFHVRRQARAYRTVLKESRMHLDSEIWEYIFEDGLQTKEQKIS